MAAIEQDYNADKVVAVMVGVSFIIKAKFEIFKLGSLDTLQSCNRSKTF